MLLRGGALACGLWAVAALAQNVQPAEIPAKRLSAAPVIDGQVSSAEWADALKIEEFWFPVRQQRGSFPTIAYLGFDEQYLYIAFVCEDPEPEKIIANETKRGGSVDKDDFVALLVDPQNRRLEPYWFQVNPNGAQAESIPGGSTENIQWRGDWEAKAQRSPQGWSAEMRIPVKTLRYPNGQTRFGIALLRFIPRTYELYTFPNMGAFFEERRQTAWTGLKLPPTRRPLIFLPYALYDTDDDLQNHLRAGLDVKYVSDGGITGLFTHKPDFRNIAADIARVDFSYTERVLSDTRPFFQEGAGFFPTRTVFYSVRVPDLNTGLKSFGTLDRWQYGVLGLDYLDNTPNGAFARQFLLSQTQYQLDKRSYARLIGSALRGGSFHDDFWGAEANFLRELPDGEFSLRGNFYQSLGNPNSGSFMRLTIDRDAAERKLDWRIDYEEVTPNYRPRLGFAPERGYRAWVGIANLFDRPEKGPLLDWFLSVDGRARKRYGGRTLDEGINLSFQVRTKSGYGGGVLLSHLRRPPNTDRLVGLMAGWSVLDVFRQGNFFLETGRQNGGDSLYLLLEQTLTPANRFRLKLAADRQEIRYPSPTPLDREEQFIATLNYELSPERSVGGQYVYRKTLSGGASETVNNLYFTFYQRVRKGMDLFVIYGLPNADKTQNRLAVKLLMPLEL